MKAIEKVMLLERATTVPELAAKLGIPKGTIDTWNNRGRIPAKVLRSWAIKYEKPVEWFTSENGEEEKEKPQMPEHLRLLHAEIDRVIMGGKSVAEQYDIASKILKLLQEDR